MSESIHILAAANIPPRDLALALCSYPQSHRQAFLRTLFSELMRSVNPLTHETLSTLLLEATNGQTQDLNNPESPTATIHRGESSNYDTNLDAVEGLSSADGSDYFKGSRSELLRAGTGGNPEKDNNDSSNKGNSEGHMRSGISRMSPRNFRVESETHIFYPTFKDHELELQTILKSPIITRVSKFQYSTESDLADLLLYLLSP